MGSKDLLWYGKINDYNAGWGVSNQDLERCFFIFIILWNCGFLELWELGVYAIGMRHHLFGALRYFLGRHIAHHHIDTSLTRCTQDE